ncbi:peptidoglycan DD-metalloendopeptidase family protein [Caenimonas terrae]|uniref:Peptidoglycan DD-metalloendopeptidase family protein n=1 Tax=Caenimonas terrae TaxID=696074 RepID=A0ABW0NHS0_9BURK
MPQSLSRCRNWVLMLLAVTVLAGCSSTRLRAPAPVEDRSAGRQQAPASAQATRPSPSAMAPQDNTLAPPKAGYYTVRPGDTLIRIALEAGQNWRDLVRWNNLENPNVIEVGQSLRVAPPAGTTTAEVTAVRPATPATGSANVPPLAPASEARPSASAAAPMTPMTAPATAARASDAAEDDVSWAWPTAGAPTVLAGFDEARNKGLDIGGKAGDPVLASADGRVVYAGAGLRGYGNLIILKHNNTYLTAYAHNQALLVKEDQNVRKGQKIAEMGNSDADRVKLHFEIRKQGKPVDPSKYLPR